MKNIPIAQITEQYLQHVEVIRRIDINLAGEFLVMAATLMEIKSRMLIPKLPTAAREEGIGASSVEDLLDPRYELVKQLLAYKEFKDAASDLRRRAQTEAARFPRAVPKPGCVEVVAAGYRRPGSVPADRRVQCDHGQRGAFGVWP